jgi:hypothetical protein
MNGMNHHIKEFVSQVAATPRDQNLALPGGIACADREATEGRRPS